MDAGDGRSWINWKAQIGCFHCCDRRLPDPDRDEMRTFMLRSLAFRPLLGPLNSEMISMSGTKGSWRVALYEHDFPDWCGSRTWILTVGFQSPRRWALVFTSSVITKWGPCYGRAVWSKMFSCSLLRYRCIRNLLRPQTQAGP
jgi:hypothetical protein